MVTRDLLLVASLLHNQCQHRPSFEDLAIDQYTSNYCNYCFTNSYHTYFVLVIILSLSKKLSGNLRKDS